MSTTPNSTVASAGPAITVENVSKFFGRFPALREVNATFHLGRVCALLGGNGSGKSTLLRIIAGLAQPSHGRVVLGGTDLQRGIGLMAHASLLYDEMSAMENMQYFAALYGITSRQTCENAITSVGLDPALPRLVRDYSQGMRQRLSLARALVQDPNVLLLDEPFSNVDVASASQMLALLTRLRAQGKAIIVVTHQADLVRELADETITLREGRVVESGSSTASGVPS